tara:strand:- start:2169 stop:3425 length:1257 start_codon:yes stop_codon:yes gene_type:complete
MRTLILVFFIALSTLSYSQKKELREAEKAFKKGEYTKSIAIIADNKSLFDSADDKTKNKVKFLSARIDQINKNYSAAMSAYFDLKDDSTLKLDVLERLNSLSSELITAAIEESESKDYIPSSKKLYMAFLIDPVIGEDQNVSDDGMDYLYFASQNAINGKDYILALEYLIELKQRKHTGVKTKYYVTEVETNTELEVSEMQYNIYQKSDEYKNAREQQTESRYPEIVKNIALIYAQQGESDKALEAVKEARVENPEDVGLILTAAEIYIKLDEKEKFKDLISQAIEKDPNNAILYFNLGVVNSELGDKKVSREYYEKAIQIDPTYEAAYFNLTSLILEGEGDIVDEMNSLGTSRSENARYEVLKKKREDLYLECVPFLRALIDINKNKEAIMTLKNIYGTVGDNLGYVEMKKLLEELE